MFMDRTRISPKLNKVCLFSVHGILLETKLRRNNSFAAGLSPTFALPRSSKTELLPNTLLIPRRVAYLHARLPCSQPTREKIPDSLLQYDPSTEDQEFLHVCMYVCTLDPPVPLLPSFLFRRKDGMSPSWSSSATHFGTFRRITCEQCVRISSCGMVDVAAGVQTHVLLCMSVCGTGSGLKRPVFTEVFW